MLIPPASPAFSNNQRAIGFDSPRTPMKRQVLMTSSAFVQSKAAAVIKSRQDSSKVIASTLPHNSQAPRQGQRCSSGFRDRGPHQAGNLHPANREAQAHRIPSIPRPSAESRFLQRCRWRGSGDQQRQHPCPRVARESVLMRSCGEFVSKEDS